MMRTSGEGTGWLRTAGEAAEEAATALRDFTPRVMQRDGPGSRGKE